jgi:hypothetical protein
MSKAPDFKYNKHLWVFFAASKHSEANVIRCKNGVLAVTGFKVDTIASIGEKLKEGDELFQIAKLARLAHREIDSEDLWYTLTMGALVDPRLRRVRPDDIAGLRSAIILYSDYPEICQAGKHSDDQPNHFKFRLENFYRYGHNITAIRRTRFFATDEGAMGMGPLTTCPGDLVFVFRGGSIAFVLRPLGQ